MLRSIDFCVHDDNDDDMTDYITPCGCVRGNKLVALTEKYRVIKIKILFLEVNC